MLEKLPDNNKEIKAEQSSIRTEEEYIKKCVDYALSIGWVQEKDKDNLIDNYLKPIHRKYLEIIEEIRKEEVSNNELEIIIGKMNNCLIFTRRIGSTAPDNIIRSIQDAVERARDDYVEYALSSLLGIVRQVLQN